MVGENESWSSSSNNYNSSCSKQWTNISTQWFYQQSKPTIQNHFKSTELMLSHNNQSFRTKPSNNQMVFIFCIMLFWIDSHIFIYLDCLKLECKIGICLFTHIELFFYSINPRNNPVNVVSRIDLLDAFTNPW